MPGKPVIDPFEPPGDEAQHSEADGHRPAVDVAQLIDHPVQPVDRGPLPGRALPAERDLSGHDHDGDAGQDTGDHRRGEELGDPSHAEQTEEDEDPSDHQCRKGHGRGVAGAAHHRHRCHPGGQHRGRSSSPLPPTGNGPCRSLRTPGIRPRRHTDRSRRRDWPTWPWPSARAEPRPPEPDRPAHPHPARPVGNPAESAGSTRFSCLIMPDRGRRGHALSLTMMMPPTARSWTARSAVPLTSGGAAHPSGSLQKDPLSPG